MALHPEGVSLNYLCMKVLITALAALLLIGTAHAKVVYVEDNASAGGDGSSWTSAHKYLQDALAGVASGDEIWVAEGTYKPDQGAGILEGNQTASFNLVNGVGMYGGFAGTETARTPLGQNSKTVLSGEIDQNESLWSIHVVVSYKTDEDSATILDGFRIIKGNADGSVGKYNVDSERGGGLLDRESSTLYSNCIFEHNKASSGGAVHPVSSSSSFLRCVFKQNSAVGYGGAIWSDAGRIELTNCIFEENFCYQAGGALAAGRCYGEQLTITNCVFLNNAVLEDLDRYGSGRGGGAIHNWKGSPIIRGSVFIGNKAPFGGAITYFPPPADSDVPNKLNLENSFFSKNMSKNLVGHGIWVEDSVFSQTPPYSIKNEYGYDMYVFDALPNNGYGNLEQGLRELAPTIPESNQSILNLHESNVITDLNQSASVRSLYPMIQNITDLIGPDEMWFTSDDGIDFTKGHPVTPSIRGGPDTAIANPGDTVKLSVVAMNASSYQWKFDGSPIDDDGIYSGAKTSTLTIQNFQDSNVGSYGITVSNDFGSASDGAIAFLKPLTSDSISESDDFSGSRDTQKWGDKDFGDGGEFIQTSGKLYYRSTDPDSDEGSGIRIWKKQAAPYGKNWSVEVEVNLPELNLGSAGEVWVWEGLAIFNTDDIDDMLFFEIEKGMGSDGSIEREIEVSVDVNDEEKFEKELITSANLSNVTLKVGWDALQKKFSFDYSEDGSTWTTLSTLDFDEDGLLASDSNAQIDWNMTSVSSFGFALFAGSENLFVSSSDNVFFDNFILKTNKTIIDSDSDGLNDEEELSLGTDPQNADTDDDGLSDGQETTAGTNPLISDKAVIDAVKANAAAFGLAPIEQLTASGATPYTYEWYYQPDWGWLWTSKSTFPYVYRSSTGGQQEGWLYFREGTASPIHFYSYEESKWVTLGE